MREGRLEYYQGRIPESHDLLEGFIAGFLRELDGLAPITTSGELRRLLFARVSNPSERFRAMLPEGRMDQIALSGNLLSAMKAKGLLGQCRPGDDRWGVPIPSLLAFLETGSYEPESKPPVGSHRD